MPNNENKPNGFSSYFEKLEFQSSVKIELGKDPKLKRKIQKDFSQFKARRYVEWETTIKSDGKTLTIYRLDL